MKALGFGAGVTLKNKSAAAAMAPFSKHQKLTSHGGVLVCKRCHHVPRGVVYAELVQDVKALARPGLLGLPRWLLALLLRGMHASSARGETLNPLNP